MGAIIDWFVGTVILSFVVWFFCNLFGHQILYFEVAQVVAFLMFIFLLFKEWIKTFAGL